MKASDRELVHNLFSHTPGAVRSRLDNRRRRLRGEEPLTRLRASTWFDSGGEPLGDTEEYVAITVRTKGLGE